MSDLTGEQWLEIDRHILKGRMMDAIRGYWEFTHVPLREAVEVVRGRQPNRTEALLADLEQELSQNETTEMEQRLEYAAAYHMHCRLTLDSGIGVILETLHQRMTYAGLLAGVPMARLNDNIIQAALVTAQGFCREGVKPHLITPRRRDYLKEPGDTGSFGVVGGIPEWLPKNLCIGVFYSGRPVSDMDKDRSYLTVVWFQDDFAMPIDAAIGGQLRAMDWKLLATDVRD